MEETKDKSFLNALNWSALVIILLSLTSLIIIIFYLTFSDNSPVINKVDVIYSSSQNDSIQKITFESYEKILEQKISDVNEIESIIEYKISEVNSFYKFIGTILAIIIAVTGFFGFKSLQELKRRTLDSVKEISENAAIKELEKEKEKLKDITTSKINEAAITAKNELLSEFYEYKIELLELTKDFDNVKSRYSKIEELDVIVNDLKQRIKLLTPDADANIIKEDSGDSVQSDEDINLDDLNEKDEFN